MDYNPQNHQGRQLILRIPSKILSNKSLSFNQKLILGLDYTLDFKKGYNKMTNKTIGKMFNLHINIVSNCRTKLVKQGYVKKKNGKYHITDLYKEGQVNDYREIKLPHQIYRHNNLTTGAKLLWGEYNSMSKGGGKYFASREYTAKRLNCSLESVTNWTKQLLEFSLLESCEYKRGYGKSQKVVVTFKFGVPSLKS